jgi:voltage-gated potassium channel Kch
MMGKTSWITITMAGADQVESPEDVRSMARLELTALSDRVDQALQASGLNRETRAHLAETKARIDRALNASLDLSP